MLTLYMNIKIHTYIIEETGTYFISQFQEFPKPFELFIFLASADSPQDDMFHLIRASCIIKTFSEG